MAGRFLFDDFALDPGDRTLRRSGAEVEVSARYLDALVLLAREEGRLVTKDHFLEEVWRGVPVTDEALTQCIRTLRRQLGDDAARPRFIETVPKHGYRFVAPVRWEEGVAGAAGKARRSWREVFVAGGAGTLGAAVAGVIGGLFYGSVGASGTPGAGGVSVLLVTAWLTIAAAVAGSVGGVAVLLLGGKLMGGSLDLLTHAFPGSRLRVDQLGRWLGESGFGLRAQFATAALEGALFGGSIVGAMHLARRGFSGGR